MRNLALALVGIALIGCSTDAQRQAVTIHANARTTAQQFEACSLAVYNSAEFSPLRSKIPFKPEAATLDQMINANLATDDEIAILIASHPKVEECRKTEIDQIAGIAPTAIPIIDAATTDGDESLIDLIERKQTWGAHIRRLKKVSAEARLRLDAEGNRIDSDLQRSHEAELARRQAAAMALQAFGAALQHSAAEQRANAPPAPITCQTYNPGNRSPIITTTCQ